MANSIPYNNLPIFDLEYAKIKTKYSILQPNCIDFRIVM